MNPTSSGSDSNPLLPQSGYSALPNIKDFQWDPVRNLPYMATATGGKKYWPLDQFDPKTGQFLGANPNSQLGTGSSFAKNGKEWNQDTGQYDNATNWGNLIGAGTAGTIGGFGVAGLLGAGGGAASTLGPSTGANMAATDAAWGSVPAGIAAPLESVAGPGLGAAAGGIGGATGVSSGVSKLLQALVGGGGAIAGKLLADNAASSAVPPQLSQLLDMGVQRAQYQNPLFQAMTSGAYQMLPDFAKTGITPPKVGG